MQTVLVDQQAAHTHHLIQVGDQLTSVYGLQHVHHMYKTVQHLVTVQLDRKLTAHYMMAVTIQLLVTTLHKLLVTVLEHGCLTMVEQNLCQCLHTTHILGTCVKQAEELVLLTVTTHTVHTVQLQKELILMKHQ